MILINKCLIIGLILLICNSGNGQPKLKLNSVEQGWGKIQTNRTVDSNPIKVNGRYFSQGIGTHSNSKIIFINLNEFTELHSFIGIDDETNGKGSARFIIKADDKELFRSKILRGSETAETVLIKLQNCVTLELITDDGGDGIDYDHTNWGDIYLTSKTGGKIFLSDLIKPTNIFLDTKNSSYVLQYDYKNKISFCFFGNKINRNENEFISFNEDYKTYGVKGEYNPALKIIHSDGNRTTDLYFQKEEVMTETNGAVHHRIFLSDDKYSLEVILNFRLFIDEDIYEKWVEIKNGETGEITLEEFASGQLFLNAEKYFLTHFYGSWGNEFNAEESVLPIGKTIIESRIGHTSNRANPCFILSLNKPIDETNGEVYFGSLAWSGNWSIAFQKNVNNRLEVTAGINPFDSKIVLAPGEIFSTPKFIFGYSNQGMGEASRRLHRYLRKYRLSGNDADRPIVLNSWEAAYFDFTSDKLKTMISAASEIGVEMFVLDDGWFGNKFPRDNDLAGLGDWVVNEKKLPGGLQPIIDYAHQKGMKFGLWIEPEMVNPKSELFEEHPDWVIEVSNRKNTLSRNQLLLDFSNPAVVDNIFNQLKRLLDNYNGIDYIKWDYNRSVSEPGSNFLAPDKQTELWVRKTKGYYSLFEKLRNEYPDITFQTCSGGGGRIDYGVLAFAQEFWTSDNTDPLQRIFIQNGASYFYPACTIAAHVSASPNHESGRVSPLKFRFDVAMSGRLGLELDPSKLEPGGKEFAKKQIEFYKMIRPIVQHGELFRLEQPREGSRVVLMYTDEDKDRAVLFAYLMESKVGSSFTNVKINGLDPLKKYKISEDVRTLDKQTHLSDDLKIFSAESLEQIGIRINLSYQYDSAVILLEAVNE